MLRVEDVAGGVVPGWMPASDSEAIDWPYKLPSIAGSALAR